MARPKELAGVNKICAQCSRSCKQAANTVIIHCPQFQPTPPNPSLVKKSLSPSGHGKSDVD